MPYKIGLAEKRKNVIEKELERIVKSITSMGVKKIILIGSLARDKIHKASDIDLIIIKRNQNQR
jgi:predicted nucleotidyltransferase